MKKRVLSLLLALTMVLSMLPVSALAADAPFTVIVNDEEMTEITESTLEWIDMMSGELAEVPCYTVTVPDDATEATLRFDSEKQWYYYNCEGTYIGAGETSATALVEHTVAVQDSNDDSELDGISVQEPDAWFAEYFIQFKYETEVGGGDEDGEDESADPFLSIAIDGENVGEDSIEYRGIFKMGDYHKDEQQENQDTYDYVHEVPYYYVTVPCGTESVDVTYSADTNIMDYGSDAYGYATVIDADVDLVSSATVKSRTFKNAYTLNDDDTQTVRTPVTGYTVDGDGNGMAITLEEDGGTYAAICLFSFKYDGKNHVYDNGTITTAPTCEDEGVKTFTCSCGDSYTEAVDATGHSYTDGTCETCGAADPDYTAPGAAIPEGMNIDSITDVTVFEEGEEISFSMWGMEYGPVPSFVATVPEGTDAVTLTFKAGKYPAPYNDSYTGVLSLSGGWVTYNADEDTYSGTGTSHVPTEAGETHSINLDVAAMIDAGKWYCAYDVSNAPLYLLCFKYPAGAHTHEYGDGVVTTEPTCENPGVKTFTCACGETKTETVTALGHAWNDGEVTTQPTCEGAGEKTFTCSNDASHTKTEAVSATGHSWNEGEITTEPTCTEAGVKTYTCQTDGNHTKTEAVSALGHEWGDDKICDRDGCGAFNNEPEKDENGVYQVGTAMELLWFAEAVNDGQTALDAVLTADIDLTGKEWPGIGTSGKRFAGTFDGNGKTVTFANAAHGLFAYAFGASSADPAVIKNVTTAGTVYSVAAVVEIARSAAYGKDAYVRIQNCINFADVTSTTYAAGIVADARGNVKIEECANIGRISGDANDNANPGVGGIVGYIQGYPSACSLLNCYNLGEIVNNSGKELNGGLIGNMYNAVSLTNSYNGGEAGYGIAGRVFNKTDSITNCYYLSTKTAEGVPEAAMSYENVNPVSKTIAEITSADFAVLLGDAFQQSCPGPVFTWQTPAEHQLNADNACTVCGLGVKQTFNVTLTSGTGYTITGESTVKEGETYLFTVTIEEGYQKAESGFAVKVNGDECVGYSGQYAVANVEGPLTITVTGVEKIPDFFNITLPKTGNGYAVVMEEGCTTTVARNGNYSFTVAFADGFRAGEDFTVKVNDKAVTADENGVYTVENVLKAQVITISGEEMIPYEETVSVSFTITQGTTKFHVAKGINRAVVMDTMEVPYFDIALYGLERYYYNPYCYVDKDGNPINQSAGNKETAYGIVTVMHAYIYATEVYYLGYDPADACKGLSYQKMESNGKSEFDNAVSWTQGAGSSFMNLWSFGTNLNYYVNYMYPLGRPAWGATSDQIPLKDGDVISVHLIEGSASGSNFAFFTVNDEDLSFDFSEDQVDEAVVGQFDEITLTMYRAGPNGQYITGYSRMKDEQLYWVEAKNFHYDLLATVETDEEPVEDEETQLETIWKTEGFAGMTAAEFVTDETGCITIDASKLAPGTYYIAARGGNTPGGMVDVDGFVSAGNETGIGLFKLVVEDCKHKIAQAEAKAPTCTEVGWEAYEYCTVEGCDYSTYVEKAAAGHSMIHVEAKSATYSASGNKEYWSCPVCEKLFTDAEGLNETTLAAVTLPKLVREENDRPSRPSYNNSKEESKIETETVKNDDGSVTVTVTDKTTGESKETTTTTDGITGTVVTDENNTVTEVSAEIPAKAANTEKVLVLPVTVPTLYGKQSSVMVKISVSAAADPVRVAIPVDNAGTGTVAVIVKEDGSEEIVNSSILTENGLELTLEDSVTVKILDNSKYFADVRGTNHWSGDSVDFVTSRELFNGTSADSFSPDVTMTRGMLLTVLARLEGVDTNGGSIWYEKGVAWAVENGLSDGSAAEGNITREQLAVILFRYAQMKGMNAVTLEENLVGYTDGIAISDYAVQAMNWAVGKGIITGISGSELAPQGSATRAQVATMLHRFCLLMAQAG